jgi:hypothetical protein
VRKYVFLTTLIATLLSCNVKKGEDTNVAPVSFTSGLPMRWDAGQLPLNVKIATSIHSADSTIEVNGFSLIEQAQHSWNTADTQRTYFALDPDNTKTTTNIETALDNYIDSEIGIYEHSTWFNDVGSGVLAVTAYLANDRGTYLQMIHGDIILNRRDFNFTNDASNIGQFDLPTVVIHELGHLIGLGHNLESTNSIMYPSVSSSDVKRTPTLNDTNSITSLYNATLALRASPLALAITNEDEDPKDKYVRGYIELRADGHCVHKQNGKIINTHRWK